MQKTFKDRVFDAHTAEEFNALTLELFNLQARGNIVYKAWLDLIHCNPNSVSHWSEIPCMPVDFFKSHRVMTGAFHPELAFETSGTTGAQSGWHYIKDAEIYEQSFIKGFEYFWGDPGDYCFLALLPGYLERKESSLVYMVEKLMQKGKHPLNGYFLYNHTELFERLAVAEKNGQKTMLIGVTFALLDFAENFPIPLQHTIIVETGGMKGRRREMIREEVHHELTNAFQTKKIASEYGMTELLSQAWSLGDGKFSTPPWMRVLLRDPQDPLSTAEKNDGAIHIIDLANIDSCAFLATQDIGKRYPSTNTFEVLGRFDFSDLRGCNLMIS
jgi:phenylacetate-coenzyme A ligase PaaK-like adenylate-forming protein